MGVHGLIDNTHSASTKFGLDAIGAKGFANHGPTSCGLQFYSRWKKSSSLMASVMMLCRSRMRHHEQRARPLQHAIERQPHILRIECRKAFVENHYLRILQQCPGNVNPAA